MRPLTSDDPEEIGGHRLLARLGAGGMGVVYLARTAGGALVALKTIRAEHAADPVFRTRFRREVTAVRGLTGRWLVPVVAADTEGREPWLATEFVPGPSLAEAVDGLGALPVAAVRTLGSRLADALTAVHDAGVVHRDVKPGNILLALDGPRLIDFGIAHAAGATALTAPDAVVGTPGFLAPEQAQARAGEVGPASDVFALGCVLAYAASGRRPFGSGSAAGVLFRTVHEEPDLTDVPGELRALAGRCLAKDPAERPTAREVAAALRDPRVSLSRQISEGREEGSLPPAVLRMVAERSARALDVPTPQRSPRQPTFGDAADDGPAPSASQDARPPTRRRVLLMGSAAASVVAVGGGVTAYLAGRGTNGGSDGALPVHTLGFQADLSGPNKADGVAQERGARLAVEQHNARAGITFRLALDTVDDRGEAARAKQAARRFTEAKVSAVLGPSAAVAALAAGPLYQDARTAMVLISVGADSVLSANLRTLRVTRAPESFQAFPLTSYLTDVRLVDRTAVIDDRAAGRTGWELTNWLRLQPPDEGTTSVHPVAAGSDDFAPAVRAALAAKAQAVVFSGTSPERAARCARALADAGFTGPRLATWRIMRPTFLQEAGTAGQDWLFGTPFTDPGSVSRTFRTAYRARYGTAPGRWAPEAYDAVGLVTRALERLGGTADIEAGAVAQRIFTGTYQGLAKTLRFTDGSHTLDPRGALYFLFQAKGDAFRFLGRNDQVKPVQG
ncbi:bifunctional serine/threonine-protein kinase/ABC transporter substrate-binding protein [Streptomyces sp. NBC_01373]|uniref:bifunctional serine/threonine-protein kinase/ABC transporter substrate-binding protein n=1 Tax=Streptomyces sp. NBC_01373 TaxID=2903843 RepID=UPI0022534EA2|nr:bifunctional serine/threonine-protein kinase/ABC transporter substrate-binding protein [Streptomyces sp. NBC_01373]MCX4703713.1 bifunctional serine/threonine-protein kinase/ABC transporter substrate-binding protein [Streptomyces sp. NBC_01373]